VAKATSAQGFKLKAKDPIRSAFSFELPDVRIYKGYATPDHG